MKRTCKHGQVIGAQGGVAQSDIDPCTSETDAMYLLRFYSACDCCDTLMHHDKIGHGYFVMLDGRTLCSPCAQTEPLNEFDGAVPEKEPQ